MQKVLVGCKLCGKRMLTHLSPLFKRRCLQGRATPRGESQACRPTQGATPRCQGSAEATTVPAVRQAHQGCQPA